MTFLRPINDKHDQNFDEKLAAHNLHAFCPLILFIASKMPFSIILKKCPASDRGARVFFL